MWWTRNQNLFIPRNEKIRNKFGRDWKCNLGCFKLEYFKGSD